MKVMLLQPCRDKFTDEYYPQGEVREFEEARALEIIEIGFGAEVKEEPQEEIDNGVDLTKLSKEELKEVAKEWDVPVRGTKEEIIDRILEAQANDIDIV